MQTTSRMAVNVFNLVNGSCKSKYRQELLYNKYILIFSNSITYIVSKNDQKVRTTPVKEKGKKIFFFLRTQNVDLSSLLIYLQLKGHVSNKTLEWLKAHTLYVRFMKLKLLNRNVFSESANHNKVQL